MVQSPASGGKPLLNDSVDDNRVAVNSLAADSLELRDEKQGELVQISLETSTNTTIDESPPKPKRKSIGGFLNDTFSFLVNGCADIGNSSCASASSACVLDNDISYDGYSKKWAKAVNDARILKVGQQVEARQGGHSEWLPATVVSAPGDGSYQLEYEGGLMEPSVRRYRIRIEGEVLADIVPDLEVDVSALGITTPAIVTAVNEDGTINVKYTGTLEGM
jgi:hypothetical protein